MKDTKDKVYITGHKNPDSDSICAAIAYADFKNANGEKNAIPVRLGNVNRETKFILEYFGLEAPTLIDTVRLRVEDLDYDKLAPVTSDISLKMAWNLMKKLGINSIPVVDESEHLIGVVSISDVTQSYMDVWDNTILGKSSTTVENIIDTLSGTSVLLPAKGKDFRGKLVVFAMEPVSVKEIVEENDIVICGNRRDAHELAIESNVSLIIITGGHKIDEDLLEKAEEKDITIISTPYDTFTAARLIPQSIPIRHVMTKDEIVAFHIDDLVDDVKSIMTETRYGSYPVVDNENKVVGSLSRFHLISSKKKKVILVDHNERGQSVDGLDEAEILEIIDHHRVADVFTGNPIYFRNEPVGSTSTIIGSMFFENGRRPSKKIAGILCAAIISDTLLFRSPTATSVDKMIVQRLAKIADIDPEKFAMEMFKAGTSLAGKTPKEILNEDFKTFTIEEQKIGIGQTYTMDPDSLKELKGEIVSLMENMVNEKGYKALVLALTDIFNQSSELIVVGEYKDTIAEAFGKKLENSTFIAPGVLSRKKQIVPPITNAVKSLNR